MSSFTLPLQDPVTVFLLILFIILIIPIILRKLNVPGIIGLIIAGVIIGPHGLNILEQNEAIDLLAKIGIIYIMFIAGLELDLQEFMSNREKSVLFGFFTFAIPIAIGFPVCYYFLGFGFNTSFLTASMFGTHTLVTYPIVSRLGISKNQAAAITVGGTILTDTSVLIILAVILGNSRGNLDWTFWVRLGVSLAIFAAILFLLIPKVTRWFFQKFESERYSHYIFVLTVVFFAAFLAKVAGVAPIIGAFVAGLVLNKPIPSSSALMNRIDFIGNSLFIPFFLVSVGMLVDVNVILSGAEALIIAGTLLVTALCGKWLAAFFTQLVFKYSKAQRNLIFGLSSSHAAATLAVITVGYNAGILNENILNGTIIIILITCLIASFITEKAGKQIITETEDDAEDLMKASGVQHEHILLPIANIEHIGDLLEFSIYIKDDESVNPITILSVVSNDDEAEVNILKARNELEDFVREASASETNVNIMTTIDHNAASGIARISREIMADIIVLGWPKQTGLIGKLIGEKVDSILSLTDKSTFICHLDKPLNTHQRIIIAAPPLAEHENGFVHWLTKIIKLSQELSIPIHLYCNKTTVKSVQRVLIKWNLTPSITFNQFNSWRDLSALSSNIDIHKDDFLVLVSARKGAASYRDVLAHLPFKLENQFLDNSRLVIYPQKYGRSHVAERFDDITSKNLNKGIETVLKLRESVGSIFKEGGDK